MNERTRSIARTALFICVSVIVTLSAAYGIAVFVFVTPVALLAAMAFFLPALPLTWLGLNQNFLLPVGAGLWGVLAGVLLARLRGRNLKRVLMVGGVCLGLAAAVLVAGVRIGSQGKLYETHHFPGTTYPEIEIRFCGFLDASFSAYRNGMFKSKIVWLPSGHSGIGITNPASRTGQGTVTVAEKHWKPMYQVTWSEDGTKVAFARGGWYVAACNFRTGKKIEFQVYPLGYVEKDKAIDKFMKTQD